MPMPNSIYSYKKTAFKVTQIKWTHFVCQLFDHMIWHFMATMFSKGVLPKFGLFLGFDANLKILAQFWCIDFLT